MTPESDKRLRADYPLVFQRPLLNDEPIRCGDGWFQLLAKTFALLDVLISVLPESERGNYYAQQVKEKFGTLRIYMSKQTPEMSTLIEFADALSVCVCDVCGKRGALHSGDPNVPMCWVRTRCDEHINWRHHKTGLAQQT